jgi:hypothetical protein
MNQIEWLKDIIYILPIATLIWRFALMSARVKQNEKDIAEMKTLSQKQNEAIIASLNKLQDTMSEIRTDVSVLKALRGKDEESKV